MIGTLLAICIGVVVIAFVYWTVRSDLSNASYYGRRPRTRGYRRRH